MQEEQESKYHGGQHLEKSVYFNSQGEVVNSPYKYKRKNIEVPISSTGPCDHNEEKKLTISTFQRKKQTSFLDLFSCCKQPQQRQTQYDDCEVCNRRVYQSSRTVPVVINEAPYMSSIRMKSRQEQPICIYYDRLTNHQLLKSRWAIN